MKKIISNPKTKNILLFLMYFIPPVIIFMIYLLAYYPGIMPNDAIKQWRQLSTFTFTDWHPVFHTFFEWVVTRIWLSPAAIAVTQIGMFSFAFASAMYQFDKMGIKRKFLIILTALFALNPVNGTFSVTLIKDTPFIATLIFLTVILIKIFYTDGKWLHPFLNKILLVVTLVFTTLFRHNGLAPVLATAIILLFCYRKHWKSVVSVIIATGVLVCLIKGPFYSYLNVKSATDFQPLVSAVIEITAIAHFNGNVSESEKETLSKIADWKDWQNGYNKYNVYGITKAKSYHGSGFSQYKSEFIKTWISLILKNPGITFNAYLARTNIIWNITTPEDSGLSISNNIFKNKVGLKQASKLPELKTFLNTLCRISASKYVSWFLLRPALYMYFILFMCILFIKRKKLKALIVFVPVAANTAGLALVTTSSQSRYYYATVFVAVFAVLLYMYVRQGDKKKEDDILKDSDKRISILAATFSGNKGAASMLESIIDNVTDRVPGAGFDVLSVYPAEDSIQNPYKNVRIVSCKAKQIVFKAFPLSILYFLFRWLPPVKRLILKNPILDSFSKCDVVVDAAGISFVDSRKLIMNFYNFICIFIPIVLKKRVIKFSQAMGPFKKFSNRTLAKSILPKVETICARGLITESYLKELGLKNTVLCADGAFVLPEKEDVSKKVANEFKSSAFYKGKMLGMSVSSVVYKYCADSGIDYVKTIAGFIDYLTKNKGYNVIIIAQSARQDKESLKNNDLVICKKVYDLVENKEKCKNLDTEMPPREIREYIARCDMLIASRFHAMISSLYKNVPVFLIGWSHKYKEVLDMFGLGNYAVDYKLLSLELLKEKFELFENDLDKLRVKITENLDTVKASSMKNIDIIVAALEDKEIDA